MFFWSTVAMQERIWLLLAYLALMKSNQWAWIEFSLYNGSGHRSNSGRYWRRIPFDLDVNEWRKNNQRHANGVLTYMLRSEELVVCGHNSILTRIGNIVRSTAIVKRQITLTADSWRIDVSDIRRIKVRATVITLAMVHLLLLHASRWEFHLLADIRQKRPHSQRQINRCLPRRPVSILQHVNSWAHSTAM